MRVFVTGGANGIGRAAVERLVENGQEVVVYDHDGSALAALPEDVVTYEGDVSDRERVTSVVEEEAFDVLVNCAGFQAQGAVEDMRLETFRQHMETNYYGVINTVQAALPMLRENGGRIVNVSSLAGVVSMPFLGGYCASKFALEAVSDALRRELYDTDVDVVVVEPGKIQTGFNEDGARHMETFLPDTRFADRYREKLAAANSDDGLGGYAAEKAAAVVVTAVESGRPRIRYTAPRYLWVARLLDAVVPGWLADRVLR